MAVNWSTLPLELLGDIVFKLHSIEDFIYFPAVCQSWNRAWSSIKHLWSAPSLPWLLLAENTKDNPNYLRNIFNLNYNKRYSLNLPETFGARCWGSPYGWVAIAKRDLTVQLFNPITKATINFPSLQTVPDLPTFGPEEFVDDWYDYYQWILVIFLKKLIVLQVSQSSGGHPEYVIMLLAFFSNGPSFARHGDQSWTTISIKESRVRMLDVIATKDHVFALYDDYRGEVAYWSVKEFNGVGVVKPKVYSLGKYGIFKRLNTNITRAYLVLLGSTDLFMVVRFKKEVLNSDGSDYDYDIVYRTIDFKIYKFNPKDKNWEDVEDLGDVALFVGDNSSMSVCLAHAKGLKPSGIYFTDDESEVWIRQKVNLTLGGHDMGVFDMRTSHIARFCQGDDTRSSFCTPTWFIPQF